jgi:hypothetical protein
MLGQGPQPGGQRLLQAVREQRDPPQRRHPPLDPGQPHHGPDGDPDQPPRGSEQQQGQRQLDPQGSDQAHGETMRAPGERQVEPGVADQQRAGDVHQDDEDLALVPRRPGGRGEAGQLGEVEPDPDAPPVMGDVAHGQGHQEDGDPGGQPDAAGQHEQQAEPPAPQAPGVGQRVRVVDGGQPAGQLTPFVRGQPA